LQKTQCLDQPNIARINGVHYSVGPEGVSEIGRGSGGVLFIIRFHDGRVIATRNLWCQGEIPVAWKKELPDNATFVSPQMLVRPTRSSLK
jgi:hypothetical protein